MPQDRSGRESGELSLSSYNFAYPTPQAYYLRPKDIHNQRELLRKPYKLFNINNKKTPHYKYIPDLPLSLNSKFQF